MLINDRHRETEAILTEETVKKIASLAEKPSSGMTTIKDIFVQYGSSRLILY